MRDATLKLAQPERCEIPITFVDRLAGTSKMSKKIVREAIVMVWKLRLQSMTGRLR